MKNTDQSSINYLIGLSIAFVQSVCMGSIQVVVRRLAIKKVHYALTMLYTTYLGKIN